MNIRNELAKLRQRANAAASEDVVREISDIMDELSANAEPGGATRQQLSLEEIFDEFTDHQEP
ncbi:hypothetical protein AWM79_15655 [Pseudomonas agarici]|uniref:Uncharacterized protein n=1 Tax=Pseudomonas agarici TaxID=46677 RepID=A0A0X1T3Y5_PSEAA|nr:hypothetical protein [Pseudomonas agarici]AMB86662.1 hypothetical protein AWM79_15655 [Pseudomonas agarici]